MKVIAIAQLSDIKSRNKYYRLKFRIFRSDGTESQKINDMVQRYNTKLKDFNKDNMNFSSFNVIKE